MTPADLLARWRSEADTYARDAALVSADKLLRRVAAEAESALGAWLTEPLSVTQASSTGGYTEDHLRTMVREGELPSVQPGGRIHIRRCDVPRKRTHPLRIA